MIDDDDDDDVLGGYWDREFDPDSDDECDAIRDWAAMTGQSTATVLRNREAGVYGNRCSRRAV